MTISYDTLGGSISIEPSGAIRAGDLNQRVAIVGSADTANGAIGEGEAALVASSTDATTQFGADSELQRQAELSLANGASEVYGVAVSTTEQTESVTAASDGTLSISPICDPRFTTESVSVVDAGGDALTVEYTDSEPSVPSEDNTVVINPTTGAWAASSSGDYEFTVTEPSFSEPLAEAVNGTVRYVAVCSEAASVVSTLATELSTKASNFRFSRGFVGVSEEVAPIDVGSYTPGVDDFRVIEVASSYGTTTNGDMARTCGAVAGLAAQQPIDVTGSVTFDNLVGFASLATSYTPSQAEQFERVTAITDTMEIAEGVTTSSEAEFSDIYKAEIIDYAVEQLYRRVKNYRGGSNARGSQRKFRSRLKRTLSSLSAPNAQPPLLADGEGGRPYTLDVGVGETDTETAVTIGIDPAPIAKQVNVNVSVGPLQFNGVETA